MSASPATNPPMCAASATSRSSSSESIHARCAERARTAPNEFEHCTGTLQHDGLSVGRPERSSRGNSTNGPWGSEGLAHTVSGIVIGPRRAAPLPAAASWRSGSNWRTFGSPFSTNDLRNLIVVAIARMMWTDARHRDVVAHGGTAQSATTICFRCSLDQVPSAAAIGARGSLAPRLLAGPVGRRDALH